MTGRRLFLITLILLFGLGSQALAASYPLIVKIPPAANIATIAAALGSTVIDSIPGADVHLLNVPFVPPPATASLLGIEWMELNKSVTVPRFARRSVLSLPAGTPADWYKSQPWMQLVKAGSALAYSTGQGVVVADINSQVDYAHRALIGHLTSGYDFVASRPAGQPFMDQSEAGFLDQSEAGFLDQSEAGFLDQSEAGFLDQSDPGYLNGLNPAFSHGTISAGIIAALAPGSMIMPLRVFDDDGHSDLFALAKAIRYAAQQGAQVINLNFSTLQPSLAIENAVGFAQSFNALVVTGAGNENTSQPQYPAAFNGVLAAAATTITDSKAPFSNYGSHVFVSAPGVNVISAYPNGYYTMVSGTSLSSAIVAGTAALVRSIRPAGVPGSIATAAVNIGAANLAYLNQLGSGRVDVLGAAEQTGIPAITAVSPATGSQGQTLTIMVTGRSTHFAQGTTQVSLGADVTVTNVTVADPTSLTAQVIVGNSATTGIQTLSATTGAEVATLNSAFTITPGIAALTLVLPNSARQGDPVTVSIQGQLTNFVPGMTQVSLGDGVTVTGVNVSGSTALTVQASVSPTAAVGSRNVTVTTGAQVVTLNNGFAVGAGLPVITTVQPAVGKQGESLTLALTGRFTHFTAGVTRVTFNGGIVVGSVAVNGATSLTAELTITPDAVPFARGLAVMTGGEIVMLDNAFTVTPGTPVVTGITPNTGRQSEIVSITITGQYTHFAAGVTQVDLGPGLAANVTVAGATSLTAQLSIAETAAIGARTLTVMTGSEIVTLGSAFTVTPGLPALTSVAPNRAQHADSLTVNIQGRFTNFAAGTTQVSLGEGVTIHSISVSGAAALSVQVSVSPEAPVGPRAVTVATGAEVLALNNAFTVNARPPVVTSVTPNTSQQGQTVTLAITGQFTHFAAGTSQVSVDGGITVNSVNVTSESSLTAQLTIPAGAAPGSRTLVVTTGSEVVTYAGAFLVTPGTPVLAGISSNIARQAEIVNLTIMGQFTHFAAGTTQVDLGPGVTATVTAAGPTALSAQLSVSETAAIGARTLTVATGGEVVSLSNAFIITPGVPGLTLVYPNSASQGDSLTVYIHGRFTNFAAGATQVSFGEGIIVQNPAVFTAAGLNVQVTVAPGAVEGPRPITVTTGAEVLTMNNAFMATPGTTVVP